MIIRIESLNSLFEKNNNKTQLNFKGRCHSCGCYVEVKISKTSGGYGFNGGTLCEPRQNKILVLCLICYESSKVSQRSMTDAV